MAVLSLSCLGCGRVLLTTTHDYLLLRTEAGVAQVLGDDDPLYQDFQDGVLSDPYLAFLVSLFENATESYRATNIRVPVPATAAAHLMIVLDSKTTGTLDDLAVRYEEHSFDVELALGLGRNGQVDLAWARQHMAAAMGPLLLGLAGVALGPTQAVQWSTLDQVTSPDRALVEGFSTALGVTYGQNPDVSVQLRGASSQDVQMDLLLSVFERVPRNGFRFAASGGQATSALRSREEAMRVPGVVATFFFRLIERAGSFYPQRHMLWFVDYTPEQTPYGKVLLAVNRMSSQGTASVDSFVEAYISTFPADREMILSLADEVFGRTP